MSLPVPLSIVLSNSQDTRRVTRDARDLILREAVPGGFSSAVVPLDRPLSLQPPEIAYYGRLAVFDARNGAPVWDGRLEDPARSVGSDGQIWELAAVGMQVHAEDRAAPMIYVDKNVNNWLPWSLSKEYIDITTRSETDPQILMKVTRGVVWVQNDDARVVYRLLADAGLKLARVSCTWDTGTISSNDILELRTGVGFGGTTLVEQDTWDSAGGTMLGSLGGGNAITNGHDTPHLRIARITSNLTVPDENIWATFFNIVVRGRLVDKIGFDITTGYSTNTITATEVITDLIGRFLPKYDQFGFLPAVTSYAIDQLAYTDPVSPREILDDLMVLEPAYYWAVWEYLPNAATPGYRLEWTTWPTSPRYEADITDGYTSQASAEGLYNEARVRWVDSGGRAKMETRTSSVPELTAAGLTRSASIDLGEALGSQANAQRAGDLFLADHAAAPNAGSLTIARPIVDRDSGRMVQPWEIRAGQLIRVRGILPRADSVNLNTRDGVTIFRIKAKEFSASTGAAVLELDSYPVSTARALAALQRRPVISKRRW